MTQQEKNTAFISQFRIDNNIKTQSKMPTVGDEFNKMIISDGCTLQTGLAWKKFADGVKYGVVDCDAMFVLLDMAKHCNCKPWHLVQLARDNFGVREFNEEAIRTLQSHMLADTSEEGGDDDEVRPEPREADVDDDIEDIETLDEEEDAAITQLKETFEREDAYRESDTRPVTPEPTVARRAPPAPKKRNLTSVVDDWKRGALLSLPE